MNRFFRIFSVAAVFTLMVAGPRAYSQTWFDVGTYTHTTDKIHIGGTAEPAVQLQVTGDAAASGSFKAGEVVIAPWTGLDVGLGRVLSAVPHWVGLSQNGRYFYPNGWDLDNDALPGWFLKLDGRTGHDRFGLWHIPAGAGLHTNETEVFSVTGTGVTTVGPASASGTILIVNGNAGIGVSSPLTRFEARGTAVQSGTFRRVARFWDDSTAAVGVGAGIDFVGKYNAAGAYGQFANIKGVKANGTDGDQAGNFVISVEDIAGTTAEVVRVGPGSFSVSGDANFTGTVTGGIIRAHYQDVAEWVTAVGDLEPGSVVIVAPDSIDAVIAADQPYDSRVAGVVSAQPGLILGESSASKVMVATTGRVRVKADATAAPIRQGDLLVTGSRSGMVMKSEPVEFGGVKMHRPGTIIGKALEPLASGIGEILILLSLQ